MRSGRTIEGQPLQLMRMRDSSMVGYCVNDTPEGVHIRNVRSGYPASFAGMRVGDWVVGIDGRLNGAGRKGRRGRRCGL